MVTRRTSSHVKVELGNIEKYMATGKKDHEYHVPCSKALTWVESQSTMLCHVKMP